MGYQSRPCTINDAYCNARAMSKHRGITVNCGLCGAVVCLSCSIVSRMPRIICHTCARGLNSGTARQVRDHLTRLAASPGGSTKAPRGLADAVSSTLAPDPPSVARRKAARQAERTTPVPVPRAPASIEAPAALRSDTMLTATSAPTVPAEYPAERRKDLGYA